MKKAAILLVFIGYITTSQAQDIKSKKGENFLPEAGDWAIGFGTNDIFRYLGNSFNGNVNNGAPGLTYSEGGNFVGKKFITDKKAIRVIGNFKYTTGKDERAEFDANDELEKLAIKGNLISLQIGLGKEWRKGKTKLQGFYGADVYVKSNFEKISYTVNDVYIGALKKSEAGVGIKGFLGAEYFIFPKIALGAQYSYEAEAIYQSFKMDTTIEEIQFEKSRGIKLGSIGISAINLTLHF